MQCPFHKARMNELADLRDYVRFTVTLLAVLDPFLAIPLLAAIAIQTMAEGMKGLFPVLAG